MFLKTPQYITPPRQFHGKGKGATLRGAWPFCGDVSVGASSYLAMERKRRMEKTGNVLAAFFASTPPTGRRIMAGINKERVHAMNHRIGLVGFWAAVAGLSFAGATARAQQYTRLDVGYVETTYRPAYDFTSDRPNKAFYNNAYGVDVDVVHGYRFAVTEKISLGVAGSIGYSDARWSKRDTDYHIVYDIPGQAFVLLEPALELTSRVRVFAELGGGAGYVTQEKTATPADESRYDDSGAAWAYRLGAGVGCRISEKWEASLAYRHTAYESLCYKSYLADGTHWETVKDSPYSDSVVISLTRLW